MDYTMENEDSRPYDLIVFGATGFTGALVVEYLASLNINIEWAIAGRSLSKLDEVKASLGITALPTIVADSSDPDSLRAMVEQTRVVISTVGPYALHGTPLIMACAEAGTHYCDLTGEAQWMASVYDKATAAANETGARLVHCCGFDCIPSDMGVFFAQQTMQDLHGCYATEVSGRMGRQKGAVSGGTVASMMLAVEQGASDPVARKALQDPYSLYPPEIAPGLDGADQSGVRWDDKFQSWTGPFVMAAINTKVVRRSNALGSLLYGSDFRYEEATLADNRRSALMIAAGSALALLLFALPPTRYLLKKQLPKPGEGPSKTVRENGFFEFFVHAHHPEDQDKDVRVLVKGKRDPGYGATARMLAQAGLCLALDDLSVEGGVWTPASAMGEAFVKRLAEADVTFEVVDL